MNKLFSLKFLLLALAAVGMLSISSCKKEKENNIPTSIGEGNNTTSNCITLGEVGSVWQCSNDNYTITWTLLNDSTIYSEVENTSEYKLDFKDTTWYNYFIANEGDIVDDFTMGAPILVITKGWNSNDTTSYGTIWYKLNISDITLNIDY
ncbi:MAG: hypothetical protein J6V54_10050, partial [Bacteroidales bacterium]|nr:hypothetical protein [Bacteroidales bacterium]